MNYLIDSDYIADYLNGQIQATKLFTSFKNDDLAMSVVSYGEIYEGIYYGKDRSKHETGFKNLLEIVAVLDVTAEIAREFAVSRGDLRAKGLLIPSPDLFIAATAIHFNQTLVIRNLKHFTRIPGLTILDVNS